MMSYVVVCSLFLGGGVCGLCSCCFFQAEDGIRDLVRSRGLGDVYKRQGQVSVLAGGSGKAAFYSSFKWQIFASAGVELPGLSLIHI